MTLKFARVRDKLEEVLPLASVSFHLRCGCRIVALNLVIVAADGRSYRIASPYAVRDPIVSSHKSASRFEGVSRGTRGTMHG